MPTPLNSASPDDIVSTYQIFASYAESQEDYAG